MKRTLVLLVLVVLAGVGGVWTLTRGADDERVTAREEPTTRLYVRTVPPGAAVKIDGKRSGNSDRLFQMPADVKRVLVEVELDGRDKEKEVIVRGGRITRVEFDLSPPDEADVRTAPAPAPADADRPAPLPDGLVRTLPPVVVETVPTSGDVQVDPSTAEIRVTFSKEMTDGSWSWSTASPDTNPETTGSPRYLDDKRTCVLPVKLEAGRVYAFWLNSNKFKGFKDVQGRPAVPYLVIFETRKP